MAEVGETRRRTELLSDGLNRHEIAWAETAGRLIRENRSTYTFAVSGLRLRMELVARRVPDAVFSHRIAAYAHGMLKHPPARLDVIVPPGRRRVTGAHARRRQAPQSVQVSGLPFTTVAATLADMVGEWGSGVTARIIDERFPTHESRTGILADLGELPDGTGARLMRLVAWTPEGQRSKTEGRIARALQMRGFRVRLNRRLGPYLWDIVHDESKLIVEFDSRRYHDNSRAFRVDRARQNNVVRRGWVVLRYTDDDVELRFDAVIDEICDTIGVLMGQPPTLTEWDGTACDRLYVDLQMDWEARNQAPWPHW